MSIHHLHQLGVSPQEAIHRGLDEITQSALHTFMACPQKFALKYLLRIQTPGTSMPLLTGTAMHSAFEYIFDPANHEEHIVTRVAQSIERIHATFDAASEDSNLLLGSQLEEMERGRAQACAMVEAWVIINGAMAANWNPIASEFGVRAEPNSTQFSQRVAGKIDGIIMVDNKLYMLEHKSTSSLQYHTGNGLNLDGQLLWYSMLCDALYSNGSIPEPVSGIMYNVLVKPQHRAPRNDFKALKKKMVDAIVENPDKYFYMDRVEVPTNILESATKNFRLVVNLLDAMTKSRGWVRNFKSCRDFGGCEYVSLCSAGADVNDPDAIFELPELARFEISQEVHPELGES